MNPLTLNQRNALAECELNAPQMACSDERLHARLVEARRVWIDTREQRAMARIDCLLDEINRRKRWRA